MNLSCCSKDTSSSIYLLNDDALRSKFAYCVRVNLDILLTYCFHATKSEHDKFASHAAQLSVSERIVVHLCDRYLDMGHKVFADNWFNSVCLADYLLSRRTLLIGTIRPKRGIGIPDILKSSSVAVKSTSFVRSGNILLSKLCDKKSSSVKTLYIIDTCNVFTMHDSHCTSKHAVSNDFKKSAYICMTQLKRHTGGSQK